MKKRLLIVLLLMLLIPLTSCVNSNNSNKIEYLDDMTFGLYPQSLVEDESIINELKQIHETNERSFIEYNEEYYYLRDDSYYKVEPITWQVILKDGVKYLYSTKILDRVVFNSDEYFKPDIYSYLNKDGVPEKTKANTYEYSDLRTWLNSTFYNTAFSDAEQEQMVKYEYDGFKDSVYTLCEKDFELNIKKALKPTEFIKDKVNTYYSEEEKIDCNGYASYWLRDANSYCPYQVYGMNYDGIIYNYIDCYYIRIGVRPVIIINA